MKWTPPTPPTTRTGEKGFTAVETIVLLAILVVAVYFVVFSYYNYQIMPVSSYVDIEFLQEADNTCMNIWSANKIFHSENQVRVRERVGTRTRRVNKNVYVGWSDTSYVEIEQGDLEQAWPKGLGIDFSNTKYFSYSTHADSVIATGISGGMEYGDDGINPVRIVYSPNDPDGPWRRYNLWSDMSKFRSGEKQN
ncbi:hypothetical protein ACFLT7_07160 [candidate division KSB1 bacterium]